VKVEENQTVVIAMFIATSLLGIVNLFGAYILSNISKKQDEVSRNLKDLNDAVLGRYIQRADVEKIEADLYQVIHKMRGHMQAVRSDIDVLMALNGRQSAQPLVRREGDGP
jgi:hypothetical protein